MNLALRPLPDRIVRVIGIESARDHTLPAPMPRSMVQEYRFIEYLRELATDRQQKESLAGGAGPVNCGAGTADSLEDDHDSTWREPSGPIRRHLDPCDQLRPDTTD